MLEGRIEHYSQGQLLRVHLGRPYGTHERQPPPDSGHPCARSRQYRSPSCHARKHHYLAPCGAFSGSTELADPRGSFAKPADRKSTRLNSSHSQISYAVFCLKKKNTMTFHSNDTGVPTVYNSCKV